MAVSTVDIERPNPASPWPWAALILSVGTHALLYSLLGSHRIELPPAQKPVDVEIVQTQKPPPPPPKPPEPKKEEPPPPPKPIKIARAHLPPPPKDMPPPPTAPPPPNQPPPPKDAPPPPINIGISLSSTISSGSFAAPVGNTLYGQAPDKAANPNDSKGYAAPAAGPVHKFVPSYAVTEAPTIESDFKPPYPEEARKQGLEAQVTLQLTLDDTGKVVKAKVIQPAGHGFDEAAVEGAHHFRFKPARLNGQAVATEINYTITFLLD